MKKLRGVLASAFCVAMAPAAFGTMLYTTFTGTAAAGPVDVAANVVTGMNAVTITLYNLGNVSDVGQNLSGFFFTLSNGATSGTLGTNTGTLVTCCTGNSLTNPTPTNSTGWVVLTNVKPQGSTSGIELCDVGCGAAGPAQTIIGVPSSPNGSLSGNGPHNPFLDGSKTNAPVFNITISGVTPATTITASYFGFGTTLSDSDFYQGTVLTPEPATFGLVGLSLLGLGVLRKRPKS